MQGNNLKDQDASKLNRRKFLTRAGAGFVIASLPAKSVWASPAGITGSIPASGNGSQLSTVPPLALLSPGFVKNKMLSIKSGNKTITTADGNLKFKTIFGGNLFANGANRHDATFLQILNNPGSGKSGLGGSGNINIFLITMYMNAKYTGQFNINYPIISPSGFSSLYKLAVELYSMASTQGALQTAYKLDQLIKNNHVQNETFKSYYV